MKRVPLFAAVLLLLPFFSFAKAPPKTGWQTGTLVEATRFPRPCAIGNCREVVDGQRVVIETHDLYLTAEQPIARHPNLVVHGAIQFVMEKQTLWIRDQEGRIFELKIVRQELK